MQYWLPGVPLWLISLVLMTLMTATNLFSVSSFGEFEFWFAGIKVAAIVLFLVLGALFVVGAWPHKSLDFSNLTAHGGFFPHGLGAIFAAIVVVIFSMVGAEIATIAAAESPDPGKAIARATNSVIRRIAVFFVGSIFLLAVILPWDATDLAASPYVAAFQEMGIPYAADMMNAVVLTAVLSCLNSGLYTVLADAVRAGCPPRGPGRADARSAGRGVPRAAILASTRRRLPLRDRGGDLPDTVFLFLLNSSGAIILFVYLLIAISQIMLRRRTARTKLIVKMWLFPVLSIVVVVGHRRDPGRRWASTPRPYAAGAQPARLGGRAAWSTSRRSGCGPGGRRGADAAAGPRPAPPAGCWCWPTRRSTGGELLDELRAIDQERHGRVLRLRPGQPDRHRPGDARGRGLRVGGHHRGRPGPAGPDPGRCCARRTSRPTGRWATTDRCARWPRRSTQFDPDRLVICTLPEDRSAWLRYDVVDRARETYDLPVDPRGRPATSALPVGRAVTIVIGLDPGRARRRGAAPGARCWPARRRRPVWSVVVPDAVAAEPVPGGRGVPGAAGEAAEQASAGPAASSGPTSPSRYRCTGPVRWRPGCSRSCAAESATLGGAGVGRLRAAGPGLPRWGRRAAAAQLARCR